MKGPGSSPPQGPERSGRPNILFVTQVIDPQDPIFGSIAASLRVLARHCNRLAVIANEVRAVPSDFGVELHSLEKQPGVGRLRSGARYEALLYRLIRSVRPDALVAHMCPIYLVLAKPLTHALGVSTVLWYAHPSASRTLAVAERGADLVLTSLPGTYPRPSPKVRVIGQAVDMDVFRPLPPAEERDGPLRLLSLGRTGRVKGYATAIEGVSVALRHGANVELRIVGPSTTPLETAHRQELLRLIAAQGLEGRVTLEEAIPATDVPALLRGCDVLLNTTASGSGDRVVFEAMACAKPVVTSNRNFAPLLEDLPMELRFAEGDAQMLGQRLLPLAALSDADRRELGLKLRRRVEHEHSVDHWASTLAGLVGGLRPGGRALPQERSDAALTQAAERAVAPADPRSHSG